MLSYLDNLCAIILQYYTITNAIRILIIADIGVIENSESHTVCLRKG